MPLEHVDSFGYGTVADLAVADGGFWTTVGNDTDIAYGATGTGRWGGSTRYLQLAKNDAYLEMELTDDATRIVGLAVYLQDLSVHNTPIVRFYEDSTLHVEVRVTTDGEIEALRNTTQLGITSGLNLQSGRWFYLEVKATIDNSSGAVVVRKNGSTVLNLTSQDTQNGGTAVSNKVRISSIASNTAGYALRIGDLYIVSATGGDRTDFVGECQVEMSVPTANGTTNDFTALSGDNYTNVDDATANDGDTSYVQSDTVNDIDLYAMSNMTSTSGTIVGVMVKAVAKRTDVGARSLGLGVRSGSTNDFDAGQSLDTDYAYYGRIMEINPVTSSDFTYSEVNALEVGVKVSA